MTQAPENRFQEEKQGHSQAQDPASGARGRGGPRVTTGDTGVDQARKQQSPDQSSLGDFRTNLLEDKT